MQYRIIKINASSVYTRRSEPIRFWSGLWPGPRWGSSRHSLEPPSRLERGDPSHRLPPPSLRCLVLSAPPLDSPPLKRSHCSYYTKWPLILIPKTLIYQKKTIVGYICFIAKVKNKGKCMGKKLQRK